MIADRRRAQLHRAAARLPLDARAPEGRGGEPAVGRRRLRRRHVRLPGGPRRVAASASTARCRSSATCRCSCSRSCSGSRWTTRCSCSRRSRSTTSRSGDPHEAVVDGLATTGRVITSAALIMVFVFTSFVLNGDAIVKQFGVGLAGGDRDRRDDRALPARAGGHGAARERGRGGCRAGSTASLPRISIEGEDYFAERDRQRPSPAKAPATAGS